MNILCSLVWVTKINKPEMNIKEDRASTYIASDTSLILIEQSCERRLNNHVCVVEEFPFST